MATRVVSGAQIGANRHSTAMAPISDQPIRTESLLTWILIRASWQPTITATAMTKRTTSTSARVPQIAARLASTAATAALTHAANSHVCRRAAHAPAW